MSPPGHSHSHRHRHRHQRGQSSVERSASSRSPEQPRPRSQPAVADGAASSMAEDSYAAATAAAAAAEAADGEHGEHGEYYGGEYYSDYANNNYYYNYYYGAHSGSMGQPGGDAAGDDEPQDGHELLARLAPPAVVAGGDEGDEDGVDNGIDNGIDHDSDNDDDDGEYRASVTSSVLAHVYEGGLRFHAYEGTGSVMEAGGEAGEGRSASTSTGRGRLYVLPNDETEQNRDDMKHAVSLLVMRGQPFYAPVHERLVAGADVYDLGTGTGIWAIEHKYPRSVVYGVDLSPIQPNYVPSNVFFAVDDFEDDWASPPAAFDYVHMRHSLFAVEDRPALLRRIFRHLRPGGYVEFQELLSMAQSDDGSLTDATPYALRDFFRYVSAGMRQSPRLAGGDLIGGPWPSSSSASAAFSHTLSSELQAAGFRDVHAVVHKCPLGTWPRDRRLRGCGLLMRTALMDGLRAWACRPLGSSAGGLGWTNTQIEVFLVDVRKAVMDPTIHAYFPLHVVYAQKPL